MNEDVVRLDLSRRGLDRFERTVVVPSRLAAWLLFSTVAIVSAGYIEILKKIIIIYHSFSLCFTSYLRRRDFIPSTVSHRTMNSSSYLDFRDSRWLSR